MLLDPSAYLRLEVEGSLGSSATGASFATSTGDMLDVAAYGGGAFRLRLGPNARPDYGLLLAWNFADEVMSNLDAFRSAGGAFESNRRRHCRHVDNWS